jgi:lipopolysaccharide/colanic/teichoic acid biosynthesis glycosyltransferase
MILISIVLTVILKSFPLIIQKRGITKENQVFNIYKFRTIGNLSLREKINFDNEINSENIFFKPGLTQFVPGFCRWLRKTGLDELPQIVNVLKGEMSLVGPRPLTISDLEILKNRYPQHYHVRNLIIVKPGITGMWQVFGDRSEGIENLIIHDINYCEQISLLVDLRILLSTILLISQGKHIDAISSSINQNKERNTLRNTPSFISQCSNKDLIHMELGINNYFKSVLRRDGVSNNREVFSNNGNMRQKSS